MWQRECNESCWRRSASCRAGAAGRQTSVVTAWGSADAAATGFEYDLDGNLVKVTDPLGNETSYTHNGAGMVTGSTDPLGNSSSNTYDQSGRLTSTTDRNGRRREFNYDAAGKLIEERWIGTDGQTVVETLSFGYDLASKLTSASSSAGTYTFSYDGAGRVIQVTEPFNVTLDFEYDGSSNRTSVEDSFGGVTTSTYDGAGRLTRLEFEDATTEARFDQSYDARGFLQEQIRWADLAGSTFVASSAYTYDAAGRLELLVHSDDAPGTITQYEYVYDLAGGNRHPKRTHPPA